MKIYGLQKMTLLDYPEHVACTVFLGGCDFRCPFCHNFELADGSAEPLMEEEELFEFLSKRTGLLDGVAVTGGEPCLYRELPGFLSRVKEMGFPVKLDTNGYHPAMIKELLDRGLVDYIAMDIKNSEEKYASTCGVDYVDMELIKKSIELIMNSGISYEFRTTVVKELHNVDDMAGIGMLIDGAESFFIQNFTDRDTVPYGDLHPHEKADLMAFKDAVKPFVKNVELRGID